MSSSPRDGESPGSQRRPLPRRRESQTRSFELGGAKGYLTTSAYPDGALAEVEMRMAKQGSTLAGLMDALSGAWSIGLQHGAPLEVYVSKYADMRSDPAGLTNDADVPSASSAMDYVARRLAADYLEREERERLGVLTAPERAADGSRQDTIDLTGLSMSAARVATQPPPPMHASQQAQN